MTPKLGGLGKLDRNRLAAVLKKSEAAITAEQAAQALSVPVKQARLLLGSWYRKGWLSRVKRGVYIPVPLQASTTDVMVDEPWVLAQFLFTPSYIGGWSAAEHWGFTEQIFDSVCVLSTKQVHQRSQQLKGARFQVKTVRSARVFGTKKVWINNKPVQISDPTKTIVDIVNDPNLAGGGRMMADILNSYMKSEHKDLQLLMTYAEQMGSRTIFKRLGFLIEKLFPSEADIIQACHKKMSAGYSQLDPTNPGKVLVTTWGLWVPKGWKEGVPA